jgi:hypothetical protein
LTSGDIDEVFVMGVNFGAAQLAALDDSTLLYESAQDGEGRLWIADCGLWIADLKIIRPGSRR